MTAIPANAEPTAIVTADALFESALATVLILGAAGGAFGGGDFPAPVRGPLLVGVGCALLPVAAYLWRIAQHSVRAATLRMLGIANGVTALAVFGWLLLAPGFSAAGAGLTAATGAALACLATAQFAAVRVRGRQP